MLVLIAVALVCPSASHAYSFHDPSVEQVKILVLASMEARERNAHDLFISPINRQFAALDRSRISTDDLLEAMFLLSQWRVQTKRHLLSRARGASDSELGRILGQLDDLGLLLRKEECLDLDSRFNDVVEESTGPLAERFARTIANQGDLQCRMSILPQLDFPALLRRGGPGHVMVPDFRPIEGNTFRKYGWTTKEYAERELLSRYEYIDAEENAVQFRGLVIKAGDVLLIRQNHPADGINTSFSRPRAYATHSAHVVFLRRDGLVLPSVVEIHETGLRVVPLYRFLSPEFTSYGEVYRLVDTPTSFAGAIESVVDELLEDEFGYDFLASEIPADGKLDVDNRYVTCSSLVDLVLKRAGVFKSYERSDIPSGAERTLESFGLNYGAYLAPTDFLRSDAFRFVGFVDNDDLEGSLSRELVFGSYETPGSLGHLIGHYDFDFRRPPGAYRRTRNIAREVAKDSLAGRAFLLLGGFTARTFPRVTPEALGFIKLAQDADSRSFDDLIGSDEVREAAAGTSLFSLHDFESREDVRSRVAHAMRAQRRWFKPRQ